MIKHQEEFVIEKMCKVFGLSRSSYYAWLSRKPSKTALENDVLRQPNQTMSRLGSPKLTLEPED